MSFVHSKMRLDGNAQGHCGEYTGDAAQRPSTVPAPRSPARSATYTYAERQTPRCVRAGVCEAGQEDEWSTTSLLRTLARPREESKYNLHSALS